MSTKASKHKDQRVGVFVDASNMYHSSKSLYQTNVNFGKILEQAVAGRRLVRAMCYVISGSGQDEQSFFDALEKQGFEVKSKELQVFSSGAKKGDWDVGIAIDAIKLADRLDTIVLVSGDGDFTTLVEYLKMTKGCRAEVMAFGESASMKLKEAADEFIDLSEDKKTFLMPLRPFRHRIIGNMPKVLGGRDAGEKQSG
ncbi:MAG: NYN domain-containing protein [Candidatus Kerfeldbacteria bacterium]|nr:NYN domain-containing protein [Candidatus Kerfeldbacteria bacterium]